MPDDNSNATQVVYNADHKPVEVSIASTLIPYDRDDPMALFLGYRACGFSIREALVMIDRSKAWLSEQRHSAKFVELEGKIPDFRRDLSKEYIEIEFFRNFRLVLEKDYKVLLRSLGLEKDETGTEVSMSSGDWGYLYRMRAQYNAQQLGMLEAIVRGGEGGFNFSRWIADHPDVIQFSRTDKVTLGKARDNEA